MKYGILSLQHPTYAPGVWEELDVLFKGGTALNDGWRQRFLPRHVNETPERYVERLHAAAYLNYFGRVTNFFASSVFCKALHVRPARGSVDEKAYSAFAEDADGAGNGVELVLKDALTTAMVKRRALVAVDMPRADVAAATLLEEERLGLGAPYAYELPVEQLIDWRKNERGGYRWCMIRRILCDRDEPEATRATFVEEFKLWRLVDTEQGPRAAWQTFRTPAQRVGQAKPIHANRDLKPLDEGITTFQAIPIVELELPLGLCLGEIVGGAAKEHFQRRSTLISSENRSLLAIPYVKLGPQIGGMGGPIPADVAQDQSRGDDPAEQFVRKGFLVLADQDEPGFLEPNGVAYELTDKQLDKLVDEIFRVAHQMAQSVKATGQALQRSGQSKQEDRHATEIVLGEFGKEVRSFACSIYDVIAGGRGEKVFWQADGLDKFEIWDRAELVDEGTKVRQVNIPSKTFQKEYFGQVASRLLGDVTPETAAAIKKEIEEAVDAAPAPSMTPPTQDGQPEGHQPNAPGAGEPNGDEASAEDQR